MEIQKRVLVSGRVQGVGFRAATLREAQKVGGASLRGYIRNLEDGRVEAVFRGPASRVETMVAWCEKGPRLSIVERIDVSDEALDESLSWFQIVLG